MNLIDQLVIGAKIRLGDKYCQATGYDKGTIITLIEGALDHDNGLYTEIQSAPSIWDEEQKEFNSIYHLFGNDLEDFTDCEILNS